MPAPAAQILCELEIRTGGHAEANAALLATAHRAYPEGPLRFFGARRQLTAVGALLESHGVREVELERLTELGDESGMTLATEWRVFSDLVARLRRGDVRRIVFCSTSRRRLAWIVWLARRVAPLEVFVILHESAYCLGLGEGTPFERLVHRLLYRPLPDNLTLVTLGPSIAEATAERFPFARRSLAWMWHPYLYPAASPRRDAGRRPIVFASFGVAKRMKGIDDFLRLARRTRQRYGEERCQFQVLGRVVPGSVDLSDHPEVEHLGDGAEMPRSEIEACGRRAQWAVFPYRDEPYHFRSSGAIHDALAYGVPILGYDGPLLRSYFDAFGSLGELVGSYEELETAVGRAIENPPRERYDAHQEALRRAVVRLSPESLAEQYARPTPVVPAATPGHRGAG